MEQPCFYFALGDSLAHSRPGKVRKPVVLLTEKVRKPRKYATEMMEAEEHKSRILAECREMKERREADMMSAALTTNKGFSILR
jgi:hypothetical protein